MKGAEQFARIRGFISTLHKQNYNVLQFLIDVSRHKFNFPCKYPEEIAKVKEVMKELKLLS
jgi:hypothetical protein